MSVLDITPEDLNYMEGTVTGFGEHGIWVSNPTLGERFVRMGMYASAVQVGHPVKVVWANNAQGYSTVVRLDNLETHQTYMDSELYTQRAGRERFTFGSRFVHAMVALFHGRPILFNTAWLLPGLNVIPLIMAAFGLFNFGFWKGIKYNALGILVCLTTLWTLIYTVSPKDGTVAFVAVMLLGPPVLAILIMMLAMPDCIRQNWQTADVVDRCFGEPPLIDNLPRGSGLIWIVLAICGFALGVASKIEYKKHHRVFGVDMSPHIARPFMPETVLNNRQVLSPEQTAQREKRLAAERTARTENTPAEVKLKEDTAKADTEHRSNALKPALGAWAGTLSDGRTQHQYVITNTMEGSAVSIVSNDGFTGTWLGTWMYDLKTGMFKINPKNARAFDRFTPSRGYEHYAYAPHGVYGTLQNGEMRISAGPHSGRLEKQ